MVQLTEPRAELASVKATNLMTVHFNSTHLQILSQGLCLSFHLEKEKLGEADDRIKCRKVFHIHQHYPASSHEVMSLSSCGNS